jgi:hypothetical protein
MNLATVSPLLPPQGQGPRPLPASTPSSTSAPVPGGYTGSGTASQGGNLHSCPCQAVSQALGLMFMGQK